MYDLCVERVNKMYETKAIDRLVVDSLQSLRDMRANGLHRRNQHLLHETIGRTSKVDFFAYIELRWTLST